MTEPPFSNAVREVEHGPGTGWDGQGQANSGREYNHRVAANPSETRPPEDDGLTPFERFERLTKALLATPKAEIDKRRPRAKKRPKTA